MMHEIVPQLKSYHISETTGFLLESPLADLPEYFKPWIIIGKSVAQLLEKHELRDRVHEMPLLDAEKLEGHRQLRLANLLLSVVTNGYIWQDGDQGIAKVIPKQLAIPACYISEKLGLPVILTHSCVCHANWQLIDKQGQLELRNMCTITQFPGGYHCSWFFLVTAEVELNAVPGLKAIVKAQEGVKKFDIDQVIAGLEIITTTLSTMRSTVIRMFEELSPDIFYNVIRPFLSGWGGTNSPASDGILFEGVSERPKKAIGGSAAQSPPIQCFDAVLNIQHNRARQEFLDLMKQYMLPAHGDFIRAVAAGPCVRKFVITQQCDSLTEAYNKALAALEAFRSYHIQITTRYIVIPASKKKSERFESVSKKGTGGTELIPFLKCIRDTTKNHKLEK